MNKNITGHTPGPWFGPFVWNLSKPKTLTIGGKIHSRGGESDHILDIDVSCHEDEMRANALLIAKSPETLEALKVAARKLDWASELTIYNPFLKKYLKDAASDAWAKVYEAEPSKAL
jgi:hypothetical protein